MKAELKRVLIQVRGVVQGVGFRPSMFRLATGLGLCGRVWNDSSGVYIDVEGPPGNVDALVAGIPSNAPPLSVIDQIRVEERPPEGFKTFEITASEQSGGAGTLISPDVATCDDCLDELSDRANRRFRYPFINCTNCGPRYTIIAGLPYDRPATTMSRFRMCPACEAEYRDPLDRRFHAQPNACWSCGPRCELLDNQGQFVPGEDPIARAAALLAGGRIVAVKGLGGFHLAVDARNEEAVRLLRQRKRRDETPFALMAAGIETIRRQTCLTDDEAVILRTPQRPIVLLEKAPGGDLAPGIAPGNRYLGMMLPYTPLHHLLFQESGLDCLVMTSGNFSEEPIITDNRTAVEILSGIADYFLLHNRDILVRNDDSICLAYRDRVFLQRRSRGFAPAPVRMARSYPRVLAVGAELKNTFALGRGEYVFLSQHIGDMENYEVFSSFEQTIRHLEALLEIRPELLAHDLHPEYLTTKYALSRRAELPVFGVQHHHAHIASCLVDNQFYDEAIGLALDGTGYGTDGRIWGGEVLTATLTDFARRYHFENVLMPGGERAIKEPWRMAVSYLHQAYGAAFTDLPLPFVRNLAGQNLDLLLKMIDRRLNSPETSSLGRLFDGLAALSGLRQKVSFEGQAAMEFQMCLDESAAGSYELAFGDGRIVVADLIRAVVGDLLAGQTPGAVSARFHRGLVSVFLKICEQLRDERGLGAVALSGGVFQNRWLLDHLHRALEDKGFRVLTHHLVPANDGGIALGQLAVAAERYLNGWEE